MLARERKKFILLHELLILLSVSLIPPTSAVIKTELVRQQLSGTTGTLVLAAGCQETLTKYRKT